uniref:Cystatin domain-containing protein n=1 Tax=Gasterosteus aculeatus aculeatus TaxID=481459 RepID=A0AAQ4PU20_GASAC
MNEFANERNVSNCWVCQHMPISSRAPMLVPVPFTEADWAVMGWPELSHRFVSNDEDCYTPPSHTATRAQSTTAYEGEKGKVVRFAVKQFNLEKRPVGINQVMLFRLTYYKRYVQQGLRYQVQMTLGETNCTAENELLKTACTLIPNTASIRLEMGIQSIPWANDFKVTHSTWSRQNCTKPLIPTRPPNRDCTNPAPPIPVHPLTNVSRCVNFYALDGFHLGTSDCSNDIISFTTESKDLALPGKVYLVCGNIAYSCVPVVGNLRKRSVTGKCYLAYLIPLIRQADSKELAPFHVCHKRAISLGSRILSILIPSYGTYRSQEEIRALSTVLERHMNKTSIALSEMQREVNDVKHMVLQNRMALDLVLASQGGVCKIINTECCAYISDATSSVYDVVADTEQGIKELHEDHGWNPFGEMQAWVGSWGTSLLKGLLWMLGGIFLSVIIITLLVTVLKICVRKVVSTHVSVEHTSTTIQCPVQEWTPPYPDSSDSDDECEACV